MNNFNRATGSDSQEDVRELYCHTKYNYPSESSTPPCIPDLESSNYKLNERGNISQTCVPPSVSESIIDPRKSVTQIPFP